MALSVLLVVGTFVMLLWLERRRPLRRSVESKLMHSARNLAVAAASAASLQLTEVPAAEYLVALADQRQWGLLKWIPLPIWLEMTLALVLLDYTLYLWHVLVHRIPWLWRFHQVHHVDLDLDTSTALRFHFGEMVISVPWRAAQIMIIGVSPLALSVWQTALLLSIMFHHSNVRLPIRAERWLIWLIVTPRMHGIHHSIVSEETNANWSSGLTIWDWLHRTLRLNVPQVEITIGVPAYCEPKEVTLPRILGMPFGPQRPSWQLPGDGKPMRQIPETPRSQLLA